jgi:hypothetical protein
MLHQLSDITVTRSRGGIFSGGDARYRAERMLVSECPVYAIRSDNRSAVTLEHVTLIGMGTGFGWRIEDDPTMVASRFSISRFATGLHLGRENINPMPYTVMLEKGEVTDNAIGLEILREGFAIDADALFESVRFSRNATTLSVAQ